MAQEAGPRLAGMVVIVTGAFWGLYWIPVRALAAAGLPGAWGTLAITAAAAVLLGPLALNALRRGARADAAAVAATALGGAAFALYSVGMVEGRVAVIVLLYFLTPVWSTLIGQVAMGWRTPPLRIAAMLAGFCGLAAMLGAGGGAPWPRGAGEWMALAAGMLWSVATTAMHVRPALPPAVSAFALAAGAALTAALLAPVLGPLPQGAGGLAEPLAWALAAGGLWWGLSASALLWAAARLEPARTGILLMAEILVAAASAALFAGEPLLPAEIAGAALVLGAGLLEAWPQPPRRRPCPKVAM
ncbi:DMT family transporter [Mangrovicoccus sp. HB161399]|uniref:DMT family transporter n=1 Tax=Mangrovicoccus sp. HB161399 TaxID=2720392 RepID=UPI001557BEAD|nr:DMT family transporter [Mangrovicoccus sp. HB161399]